MVDTASHIYFQHEHHSEGREPPEKAEVMQEKFKAISGNIYKALPKTNPLARSFSLMDQI